MKLDENTESELPSKTRRKLEAQELQDLGEKLTTFNDQKLSKLPLPNDLLSAVKEFQRLPNSHGARRRQLQFIGKKMRKCNFQELLDAIERIERSEHSAPQLVERKPEIEKLTELTRWRDEILSQGDSAIIQAMQSYPDLDRQKLRRLYREFSRAEVSRRAEITLTLTDCLASCIKP